MNAVRRLVLARGHLAALICATALALRILFPAGYMVSAENSRFAVTLCSGTAARSVAMDHLVSGSDRSTRHGKPEAACAFAGLSVPAIGGGEVLPVLAAPVVVAVAALPAFSRTVVVAAFHLRPPLRGPPGHSRPSPAVDPAIAL